MLMFFFYILSVFTSYESLPSDIKAKLEAEFSNHKKVEFEITDEKGLEQAKQAIVLAGFAVEK